MVEQFIQFVIDQTPSAAFDTLFGGFFMSALVGLWYSSSGKYRGWRVQVLDYEGKVRLATTIETDTMIGIATKPFAGSRDLKSFASNVGLVFAFPYDRDGKFNDETGTFQLDWEHKVVTIDFRNNPPQPARLERPKQG